MLHFTVIAVGKIREKYMQEGIRDYAKRLRAYARLDLIEVADLAAPPRASLQMLEDIKRRECDGVRARLSDRDFVILLDRLGEMVDSEGLAAYLEQRAVHGISRFTFVIGGSLGVDEEMQKRADWRWSFSALTFPHQLMRLMLLEQIYRGCKIRAREVYHK